MMENNNGRQFLSYKWLVGILIGVVGFLTFFVINDINLRIKQIELERAQGFERLSTLEAQRKDISDRLDRIESKIDLIIRDYKL